MKILNRFFQFFKIDYEKLSRSHVSGLFWLDIFMIFLILFNLGWIIFEFSLQYELFRSLVGAISMRFLTWYESKISPDFMFYDLIFVAVFVAELALRWIIAIRRKTYSKWFFYPFVHWYDVLGCIPLSTFRALRLLRVFSMFYRLQRLGIIDVTSMYIYKQFDRYMEIFTEEVSDRVVVNVLNGVQDEMKKGNPVMERVVNEVLIPKQEILSSWVANRAGLITRQVFENNEDIVRRIIDNALTESLRNNKELGRLKYIPGAGNMILDVIDRSVSDITFSAIKGSMVEFSKPEVNSPLVRDVNKFVMESMLEKHEGEAHSLDDFVANISHDIIEVVKQEVKVRQWKIKEAQRKAERDARREMAG